MAGSIISDYTVNFLGKALAVSSKRQGLISSNIANIDTIGYQPKDIDFKASLTQALDERGPSTMVRSNPKHFQRGELVEPLALSRTPDSDTASVDIDQEMTRLAENNIKYRTSAEVLLRKISMIKNAITS
jgi:flagellar basal-body rod protein FlgB